MEMGFPVTSVYVAALALWMTVLAMRVGAQRFKEKRLFGYEGDTTLSRKVRVHGNAVEFVPLALILMGALEAAGVPTGLLHAFGATLLVSRIAHALGLWRSAGITAFRFIGAAGTNVCIIGGSVYLLWMQFV